MLRNRTRTEFKISGSSKSPRKSPAGRVCREASCSTVLSIYNKSDDCSVHEMSTVKPPLAP